MHLVEEPSVVDPTYIEDFLLTYRTFLSNPMEVGRKLLDWFQVDSLRDTVSLRGFWAGRCVSLQRCIEGEVVRVHEHHLDLFSIVSHVKPTLLMLPSTQLMFYVHAC